MREGGSQRGRERAKEEERAVGVGAVFFRECTHISAERMVATMGHRGHEKGVLGALLCLLLATATHQHSNNHADYRRRHHYPHRHHERSGLSPSNLAGAGNTVAWAAQVGQVGWLPRMRQTARVDKQDCACSAARARPPGGRALLSMKARGKKGRAAGAASVGGATATAGSRGSGTKKGKKKRALYIQIEDLESDSWR